MDYLIKNVEEMTIDELIGQVIMIGLPGLNLTEQYINFIKEYKIGNYILFARNYDNTSQMQNLMKQLYLYVMKITGSFPLISIDQEGGMVVRLFKDVTFPASPLTTSATQVKNAPYITGSIIGKDMLKMGINLNLAPCLEVNENLANPLVNVRGYGANKELVLQNAKQFVKGIQDSGALSCVKHFPGAGSSTKDSHLELPIIEESKENLLSYNMYPFINLLESDALMTSHCLYKAFDDVPSTLSKVLLNDLLRREIGYQGVIISDGMEMKAITDVYGIEEGCIMALNAGCDILLLCHEYDEQVAAFKAVKKAVREGKITIETLKEKAKRINNLKQKVTKGLKNYFNDNEYQIVEEEHKIMEEIVDKSYTLIKGHAPLIKGNTLIMSCNAKIASIVEDEFDERNLTLSLTNNFPQCTVVKLEEKNTLIKEYLENINKYDTIIIYSYDAYNDEFQKHVINQILNTNKEVYVISMKGPIDEEYFLNNNNYSCLYEYTPNSIKTIVKQLKGQIELTGKLPK